MFRKLYIFFISCFDVLFKMLQGLWQLLHVGFGGLVSLFLIFVCSFQWLVDYVTAKITWLTYWIQSITVMPFQVGNELYPQVFDLVPDTVRLVNTIFPIADVFLILFVGLSVKYGCMLYGLIKSWVPTVSG